ncbi:PTS lactose transporter subunit IIC [Aeromicrobium sp. PE09-221]|uniref:PTS fructose transporter subunit IIABC n=1 Tax=Aeromicrobium sp. PE09-221 TaxID=1898043 RepID=UPI000B3ED580|nr:fructose-specific PTS transporter subunit EIIC [Aeromicrobium sp. PE09-221]OUZ11287.1 PTS lactose transporter subunit IIC [Aeromicrobium sp. PE09-221]
MTDLIVPELVGLDVDLGADARAVIPALAQRVADAGRAEAEGLARDALTREGQSATGLPGGIAIPHCRSAAVSKASLAFVRLSPPADFGAPDGPADLAFLIAAPAEGDADHLALLSALARALVRPDFTAALRAATTPEEIVALVDEAVAPAAPAAVTKPEETTETEQQPQASDVSLVAVTACPTGIAHTYMAAESLERAAAEAGVELHVEPQGSSGGKRLDPAVIERAGAVIFATDVGVKDKGRFAGKPVIESGVKRGIDDGPGMIRDALAASTDPNARRVAAGGSSSSSGSTADGGSFGLRLRQWLLTGVSYMIPFVAAGGLLIALGFLLGGYDIDGEGILGEYTLFNPPPAAENAAVSVGWLTYLGAVFSVVGGYAMMFLVPALAGYIAYAMADRPGIAPGFVMGYLATQSDTGFLGGIVGGLLAGAIAMSFSRLHPPRWLAGLMPVVIIPLVTTLVAGLIMVVVLGKPIAWIMNGLEDWLTGMSDGSTLVLGAVLGLMMATDLGGPINKSAYLFATAGLAEANLGDPDSPQMMIMAAVMIGGMTPPLALALSTLLRPRIYTREERENGKAAWLLGAAFISEGAIPFAAADPLRVIPSMMLGSGVAGAIAMGTGVTLAAPHGGIFVFFAVGNVVWFFVSIIIGTLVSALAVTLAKQIGRKPAETASTGA